jgi:hypothetical protein
MQVAVLILFATRELGLSAGAIGLTYAFGGMGCVLASAFAQRLSARFGIGPVIVHGLALTALGWQAFGLISGPVWLATLLLGCAMLMFDFGAVLTASVLVRQRLRPTACGTHDGDDALLTVARPRSARSRAGRWRPRPVARNAADRRCSGPRARRGAVVDRWCGAIASTRAAAMLNCRARKRLLGRRRRTPAGRGRLSRQRPSARLNSGDSMMIVPAARGRSTASGAGTNEFGLLIQILESACP